MLCKIWKTTVTGRGRGKEQERRRKAKQMRPCQFCIGSYNETQEERECLKHPFRAAAMDAHVYFTTAAMQQHTMQQHER